MGAITGMLGLGGGAAGTGFGGPTVNPADYTGMSNLQDVYKQLGQVAAGQGPNPAQAQYFKNIQDLARQQAGAISSVQGLSPALATRMISQQGSGAMQNAAAQGAANQAAQQLGALGQMGGIAGTQANIAAEMQRNVNSVNAQLAAQQMQNQMKTIGGIVQGAGATGMFGSGIQTMAGGVPAGAEGGVAENLPHMADGGAAGPQSIVGKYFAGAAMPQMQMAGGGNVHDYRTGGHVKAQNPAEKAVKPGNSYANDKIPAMLSEGEVVIPRNVMHGKDPVRGAAEFVRAVLAKKGR